LAIVIVSANSGHWLPSCLASVQAHSGDIDIDVVVVNSGSHDETASIVGRDPRARLVECENRGFAHANNRGVETVDADWILFLNPDTEIVDGAFDELVAFARSRPEVGVIGVRQTSAAGELQFTIRRFPSPLRSLGEALGSEAWPVHPRFLGERVLDPRAYEREFACDWTSGSFMLIRREALLSAGLMDERFFLFAEEPDLCLRIRDAGWSTLHAPSMTIVHHGGNEGADMRLASQQAYSRRLFMAKHFSPARRATGLSAMALGFVLRSIIGGRDRSSAAVRRATSRAALATLLGLREPPFGPPPRQAMPRTGDEPD
jgi:N-acetylglucosaminyl-diphospho-decaprenol L-rhamnosyltransferase